MGKRGRKSKFISFNIDDRTLVHFESQDQALHAALPLLVQAILGSYADQITPASSSPDTPNPPDTPESPPP